MIIRLRISIRWAGHVANVGKRGIHMGFWWESQNEMDNWEHLDLDDRIFKCTLDNRREWYGLDSSAST
jgi:hypothetical protein